MGKTLVERTNTTSSHVGVEFSLSRAGLVLFLMFLFNVMNFVDRMLSAILQEPIKRNFHLTDTQLGLLGGPAFAVLYAVAALPIARLADRTSRVYVIAGVLAIWSGMTALCGASGNFLQLVSGRIGVSIGEAGCAPAAHALISEYFPSKRRTGAIAVFTSGSSIGTVVAAFGGGALANFYGWRVPFYVCGAVGAALAIVIVSVVREPVTRHHRQAGSVPFRVATRLLAAKSTYVHLCVGMALATLGGTAAVQYLTSFIIRAHHLALVQAAGLTGVIVGGVGFIAANFTGFVIDRGRVRQPRLQMRLPAIAVAVSAVSYCVAFTTPSFTLMLPALCVAVIGMQSYLGAGFALAQDLAPAPMRSFSAGLLMMIVGLIGYALGAPLVGIISDAVANHTLAATGLSVATCVGLKTNAQCAAAELAGLRTGLVVVLLPLLWSGVHFWLASRTMIADVADSASQRLQTQTVIA